MALIVWLSQDRHHHHTTSVCRQNCLSTLVKHEEDLSKGEGLL